MQSKISKKLTYNFGGSLLQGIPNILNGVTQSITAEDSQRGQAIGSTIGSAADLALNAIPGVGSIISQLGLGKLAGGLIGQAVQGEQPKNIVTKPNTNPYGYSNGGKMVEGLSLFNGLPHSQGGLTINDKGIPSLSGKHEVEKKEVKWLDYIFSDKLKIK